MVRSTAEFTCEVCLQKYDSEIDAELCCTEEEDDYEEEEESSESDSEEE